MRYSAVILLKISLLVEVLFLGGHPVVAHLSSKSSDFINLEIANPNSLQFDTAGHLYVNLQNRNPCPIKANPPDAGWGRYIGTLENDRSFAGKFLPLHLNENATVADQDLQIVLTHEVETPFINGSAIYKRKIEEPVQIDVSAEPASVNFGLVEIGTSVTKVIYLKNSGSNSVELSNVLLEGNSSASFSHNFSLPVTIDPGQAVNIAVVFTPVEIGFREGWLNFFITGKDTPISVYLEGEATVDSDLSEGVVLLKPKSGQIFTPEDSIVFEAQVNTPNSVEYPFLSISCPDGKWRKLKLGYNDKTLYFPRYNVIAGGNNKIEIELKPVSDVNWQKIQFRPQGSTNNPLNLSSYVTNAEVMKDGFLKITIPLSDFDPSMDFSSISVIEFPYSAGAGEFEMQLRAVRFTGGVTPYVWFGDSKSDNIHDGNGGGGQMIASLQYGLDPVVNYVQFLNGREVIFSDLVAPFSFVWKSPPEGSHDLKAAVYLSDGSVIYSEKVTITVQRGLLVKVIFEKVPESYSVSKAPLRFNKDFAYSFTFDDGKVDSYTYGLPLFKGGEISSLGKNYEGLYYTDGCGNDFAFRAGLAWNALSSNGNDPHTGKTPNDLSWVQLKDLYELYGWDVFNHSLTHKAGPGTNYNLEITENKKYIFEKTGIETTHFVVPSGDTSYYLPARNNGVKAIYDQLWGLPGSLGGLQVDKVLDYSDFKLFRSFLVNAKHDSSNVGKSIDAVAAKSNSAAHFWYNEFTHRIIPENTPGGLKFATFEFHMKQIEAKYGKSGKDNIWMAPLQEVYEYLYVRDKIRIANGINQNVLTIFLDTSGIGKLEHYTLTLNLVSDVAISTVEAPWVSWYSFQGTGNHKMINLEWNSKSDFAHTANVPPEQPQVIYRVNAGGFDDIVDEAGNWEADNSFEISPYFISAPELTQAESSMVTIQKDKSVPAGTPVDMLSTGRSLALEELDSLSYVFPVNQGGEVEVRLYFAETEFDETNKRVFDVAIENTVEISNYDIYADAGKNRAVMKSFKATSDGSIDINLIRIRHNPSIRGIEILCLNNRCNSNNLKFSSAGLREGISNRTMAYPNPFTDKLMIDSESGLPPLFNLQLFNQLGENIQNVEVNLQNGKEVQLDLSHLANGVYFLKIVSDKSVIETIKVLKQ